MSILDFLDNLPPPPATRAPRAPNLVPHPNRKPRNAPRAAQTESRPAAPQAAPPRAAPARASAYGPPDAPSGDGALYQKARAKKEAYQANLAELDFRRKSGELIPRDAVRQAAATAMSTIAQSLRSIPDNLERKLGLPPEVSEAVGIMIDDAMAELAVELERIYASNT